MTKMWQHKVKCMDCQAEIFWALEEPDLLPGQQFRCITCIKKIDPYDKTDQCLRCAAHFEPTSVWQLGCSDECEEWIDEQAERAQDRDLEREQAWLESYGEDEVDEVSYS
jgi:hypothetical protein